MTTPASLRLIAAVPDGDEAAARLALADGADPNAVSRVGPSDQPVLARAARDGRLGIVRLLLRAGARVAPPNPYQASALRSAVLRWHADVARLLIDHGALTAEPAGRRMSVLTEALQFVAFQPGPAGLATLRVLLQAGAVSHPEEEAPLVSAIMRRVAPAVLRLLLAHGADADQLRSDAAPAIVVAARRGDHAAVDVLLAAGPMWRPATGSDAPP